MKVVEAASQSCQASAAPQVAPANPNWDAIAVSLTSQSNSIAFGAVVLTAIFAIAGLAWGQIITRNAEREAREMAEKEAKKWLSEEGIPFLRREMQEWRKTFPQEGPISNEDVDAMVDAVGKEVGDGKK